MSETLNIEYWIDLITGLDTAYLYGFIFLVGYLENVVPPIPGDMVTVIAAGMVGTGRLNYFMTFAAATAGNLAGFLTMYQAGRFLGKEFFLKRNFRFFPREQIQKTESWFHKYGYRIIVFNRFLSGLRSVIAVFAGIAHLQRRKIIPLALLSACMWDGVLIYGGYVVGDNWQAFESFLNQYNKIFFALLAVVVLIIGTRWFIARKSVKSADEPPA